MSTKRDKYLKWKHELLDKCGQCMGFRAKGIDLASGSISHDCSPGMDCHKNCPALGMGSPAASKDTPKEAGNGKPRSEKNNKKTIVPECFNCGQNEQDAAILPCRYKGKSIWVCTKCLPTLIHG